jgi:hypothetical protein
MVLGIVRSQRYGVSKYLQHIPSLLHSLLGVHLRQVPFENPLLFLE